MIIFGHKYVFFAIFFGCSMEVISQWAFDLLTAHAVSSRSVHMSVAPLLLIFAFPSMLSVSEASMLAGELMGALERVVRSAVRVKGTYKQRNKHETRAFGGVNVVMCVDFWQLHPVTGTFLASNPLDAPPGCSRKALALFWLDETNCIRNFWGLTAWDNAELAI